MSANAGAFIVVLLIWLGIFIYIFRLDKKVRELERK
ncbi:MAG: CcmD family protein [candidate division Zixibacteria bacterium]|nr:CcmD family protein [candidate division Zixibacteria bacterium]